MKNSLLNEIGDEKNKKTLLEKHADLKRL